jgi:phosphinothricin acetyltransferase
LPQHAETTAKQPHPKVAGMGVRVRSACTADLEAIQAIYNRAIVETTATWDEEPWDWNRRLAWWAEHQDGCPVLVAEAGGEVVGFASLSLMSKKSGWRFTRENSVYVHPDWHRQGMGRALMEALLGEARSLGVHNVVASITSDNEPSIALHASLGFEHVGTLREAGWKFGQRRSTTYMQRLIG